MANYNDPLGGTDSSIGSQIRTDSFHKKALIDAAKEAYFGQMADVRSMPKHYGKLIKQYQYLPVLDERNVNDQGIDAAGVSILFTRTITTVVVAAADFTVSGVGVTADAARLDAEAAFIAAATALGFTVDTYANMVTAVELDAGYTSVTLNAATEGAETMYGSSKDVGTVAGKMPALSENGGRVNRVGHKRIELEGTIEKFGFFDEYTQESMDFDSDSELRMHITSESVKAANEITEDALQIDLLNGAGVVRFTGGASAITELQGNDDSDPFGTANTNDAVSYVDLMRLGIELDNNRTPKNTKLIAGSRMVDTKTIAAARYMFVGSEMIPSLERMTDLHGDRAFNAVEKYSDGGNIARGEIGSIAGFRIVVVPEMMKWAGAGDTVTTLATSFHETNAKYDVFPMLVVGDGSFTTIGFQTDGKTVKFKIMHKAPGEKTADRTDPYGETGFYSIKWYYGTMLLRPERLAVIKTIAEL